MQEIDKPKRLEELNNMPAMTEEERQEWINLMEELTPIEIEPDTTEPLEQIKKERELKPLKEELLKLEMERKKLELENEIKIEKKKIENLKKHSGLIYCDDCQKWCEPSHFN